MEAVGFVLSVLQGYQGDLVDGRVVDFVLGRRVLRRPFVELFLERILILCLGLVSFERYSYLLNVKVNSVLLLCLEEVFRMRYSVWYEDP